MAAAKAARSDGVEPSETARALTQVAIWLIRNQEYDRAEEHLQEAFTRANEIVETNPASLRSVLSTLVYLRKLKGELDSALVFQLQAMDLLDRMDVAELAHAWVGFSDLYVLRNEHDKALEVALTSLALFEQLYGPDHLMVTNATQRVATAQIGLGNYDQAKESLLRTIDILERTQGPLSSLLDQPRAQYDALVRKGREATRSPSQR